MDHLHLLHQREVPSTYHRCALRQTTSHPQLRQRRPVTHRRKRYLDFPCMVHDDEPEQDNRGEANKAFQSEGIERLLKEKDTAVPQRPYRGGRSRPATATPDPAEGRLASRCRGRSGGRRHPATGRGGRPGPGPAAGPGQAGPGRRTRGPASLGGLPEGPGPGPGRSDRLPGRARARRRRVPWCRRPRRARSR